VNANLSGNSEIGAVINGDPDHLRRHDERDLDREVAGAIGKHVSSTTSSHRATRPVLVSVTSTADWATGWAFPAGRFVNTLFERAASPEESTALKNTMGHVKDYITHKLTKTAQDPVACQGWRDSMTIDVGDRVRQMRQNLEAEDSNNRSFFGSSHRPILRDHWVRRFCGGAILTHVNYNPNSPIWNIETDKSVIKNRDVQGSTLTNFLRQLYKDSYLFPLE
jgi:hypothetical protein